MISEYKVLGADLKLVSKTRTGKLRTDSQHSQHTSPYIIMVMTSREISLAGHVAGVGDT